MNEDSPLANPAFRSLWLSNLASSTGILIQSVGASWVVVEAGAMPQQIALVQTAASLPLVLISPVAGAIADHMDRRQVMIGAQALLVTVSIALAAFAWAGLATPWLVIACTFLAGCSLALNGPAWMASIGDILPRAAIPGAVVLNAIGLNMARSVGPAIGGMIVAAAGATAAFVTNAVSSLLLIGTLWRWSGGGASERPAPQRLTTAIGEGVRYVARAVPIRAALCRALLFGAVSSSVQALMPLIARDLLNGGSVMFGLLFGSFGAGALLGALLSTRLRRTLSPETTVLACTLISAFAAAGAGFSTAFWLTAPCLALAGAAWVIAFSTFNVAVQLVSPRWVVARTLSLYQMSVFSGVALGSWLGGFAADHIGLSGSLLATSVCALASIAGGFIVPLAPSSETPADPLPAEPQRS